MKHWKPLRKRGLALFLVLMMCVSMFPTAAFAVEGGHVHNDSCVQGELTCPYDEHEHGEECYAAGEPQCGETEHEHDAEACYDENGDLACILDEHEHGEECYAAEEPQCGKTEHKHDESCYAWDCSQDEEDQEPEETQETEESRETEVPAEVQDFLDAVAKIPAVSPENAEEVAEYVYGPVSDAYEVLLGTEYEERADVQEAVARYAAAIDAVDAALGMESDPYVTRNIRLEPDMSLQQAANATNHYIRGADIAHVRVNPVTIKVGETGRGSACPINGVPCGYGHMFGGGYFAPTWYCDVDGVPDDTSVVEVTGYTKGIATDSRVAGSECMIMNYRGLKPGTTDIFLNYFCNFEMQIIGDFAVKGDNGTGKFACAYCYSLGRVNQLYVSNDGTWHYVSATHPVVVTARYQLNYDSQGGSSVSPTYQDVASTTATLTPSGTPTKEGCTFKGWAETPNGTPVTSVTLNWSEGYGSTSNPVEKTLYAIWEGDDTAPEAPVRGNLHSLLGNFVKVQCVSDGNDLPHDAKTYSVIGNWNDATIGPVYQDEGKYKVDVTLDGAIYAQFYGFDPAPGTGVTHTLKAGEAATKTITLTWNPEKPAGVNTYQHWDSGVPLGTILATFQVVCKTEPEGKITGFNKKLVKNAADVPAGVDVDGITFPGDSEVTLPADGASVTLLYTITVKGTSGAKYTVTDKGAVWVSGPKLGVEYTLDSTGTAVIYVKRTFTEGDLDNGNLVNVAKVEPGTGSNTSTTSSETTPTKTAPEAPTKEEAAEILNGKYTVKVKCTNDKREHTLAEKEYGITAEDITSISTPYQNASGKWEVEVSSINDKFIDKFDAETDVACTHADKSGGFSVKLVWDGSAWTYAGTYTREIETECTTTYKICREYYVNGIKKATVNGGEQTGVVGQVLVGKDLASANPMWKKYSITDKQGTYKYPFEYTGSYEGVVVNGNASVGAKADSVTLTANEATNVIVLRYCFGITAQDVNRMVRDDNPANRSAVVVSCEPERHAVGYFDCYNVEDDGTVIHTDRIKIDEWPLTTDEGSTYTCKVTFLAEKYRDAYNDLRNTVTEETKHQLVDGQEDVTVEFVWNSTEGWKLAEGTETPVEFQVECPEETFNYRLEYHLNGGDGTFTAQTYPTANGTTDTSHEFTLSSTAPTLAGKIFVGWADSQEAANAGIVSYGKGAKVTVTSTDATKEVGDITYRCKTVYAVWVSTSEVGIGVTKTIQKQITGTDGSTGWRDLKDDEALKNGDVVRYTVKVQNTSEALSLTDLTLFDDMDRKLTDVKNIKISKGRTATSQYYAATEEESPLLYFQVEGELEVNDTYTVWYEATVQNADGEKVENTATAYAEVVPELAARSVQYGTSASTGAGAESDGQVDVDSGVGTGDRPTRPSGGVSGSGNNGANTETDQPSLSVTKTAKIDGVDVTADTKAKVGDVISYVVTVKNTGNVTLTGVTVEDSMADKVTLESGSSFAPFDLAVGAEHQISYTYTVKATDVGGNVVNTVTVSHTDITTPVTATKTVQVPAPDTFTVTFNANGGKWEDNALTKAVSSIAANGTVGNQMPADPAYANYRFTGWNTQSDGSGTAFTGDTPVTGNITVYAQWQEKEDAAVTYPEFQDEDGDGEPDKLPEDTTDDVEAGVKIIVNPNGGAWTPTDSDKWTESGDTFNRTAQEGEEIALTPDPVKDGSVFMGWKKEVSDDGTTITFTAQWEEDKYGPTDDDDPTKKDEGDGIPDSWQYTVTYEAIGGTVTSASTVVVTKLDESGKPSATGTAKLADKHLPTTQPNKGYKTPGAWDTEPTKGTVIKQDTTFTITYTQFTVTVQPNNDEGGTWTDGSTEPDVKTPNEEGKVTIPDGTGIIPPANKELDKWVDQNDTEYQPGQVIEPGKDLTLEPVWKDIIPDAVIVSAASVTATYDGQGHPVTGVTVTKNGESVTPDNYTITYSGIGTTAPVNAGTYTATITAVVDGQTVTGTAVVTINRRPVTITSNSASRVYNGSALTNHSVTVGGQGFVAGQGATYAFTGTQTAVGSSSNYFTYRLNAGTLATNYSITTSLGTLRVTSAGGGGSTTSGGGGGGGSRPSTSPTRPSGSSTTTISDTDVPLAGDLQLNKTDHFAYIKGYQDGTVRPNNPITRAQVATIFYRLLDETSRVIYFQETNDFTDVANDYWANKAISTLTNAGIITGFSDGTFRPNANITRAQFAAIAARFDNVVPGLNNPFTDVAEDYWARDLIAFAADRGWITGNGGKFRPLENITRVEVMDFINNVLERHVDEEGLLENATKWSDVPVTDPNYYVVEEATNSHDYTRRTDGQLMENWTKLNPDPVWDE